MSPLVFMIICEAAADFRTATGLVERIVCNSVDWIEPGQTEHFYRWQGRNDHYPFWLWEEIDDQARQSGVKVRGHFDKEPGSPAARIARRALIHLENLRDRGQRIDGILLIRDSDGDLGRMVGLEQARRAVLALSSRIVIGLAHLKRECWALAGFETRNDREVALLAEIRQKVSFDPIVESHRLTAKLDHELRSAKRALAKLTQEQHQREEACWRLTPPETLRQRGGASGLTAFLGEAETHLVPLFVEQPA